jgi:integrase
MYVEALESGRKKAKGGLSPRSVHMMHRVLSQAFKQAVRWQLLIRNLCDAVAPPRVERKQMRVLDANGAVALLEASRARAVFMPILLGLLCGVRRGEAAALRWRNVNFDSAQLSIVASFEQTNRGVRLKPPKSGRSRRVAMPAISSRRTAQSPSKTGGRIAKGRCQAIG